MDYKFLNKVVDQIMRETQMVYPTSDELGYVNFPFSRICGIHDSLIKKNWTILETHGFFSLSPSRPFIQHLKEVYGITQKDLYNYESDSEVFYLWNKYIEVFMDKLKKGINIVDVYDSNTPNRRVDQLDESKSSDTKFLNKLLGHIKSETKFKEKSKYSSYVQLPFFPEDWYRGLDDMYITDFIHWIHTTLGINDPIEIEYLWKRYLKWVNKKCNG